METATKQTPQQVVIEQLHSRLAHIVTQYDMKQQGKRGHNMYALGHYLGAVQGICDELTANPKLETRAVIVDHFNGRLLDVILRGLGFATSTRAEQMESFL